jgi:hypothetical protein
MQANHMKHVIGCMMIQLSLIYRSDLKLIETHDFEK